MKISVAEAKAQFADIIRRAAAGEEIELTRYGKPVARVVPPKPERKISIIGCMKGQFTFDDPYAGDDEIAELFAASEIFPK